MKQRKLSYVSGFWAFFTRVQPSTAGPPSHNDSVANPTSLSIPIFTMSHPHNTHPCAVTHQPRPNVNEISQCKRGFRVNRGSESNSTPRSHPFLSYTNSATRSRLAEVDCANFVGCNSHSNGDAGSIVQFHQRAACQIKS